VVNVRGKAYCNVKVYRLERDAAGNELSRTLHCKRHNLVTTSGLNQLRDACNGAAWQLSAIGLGEDGTAVTAADTWGLSPLVCEAPTTSSYKGNRFRATSLLEEDNQNGETIREVWISPDTTGPPGGEDCYARVVIDDIAKTDEYAYLFLFDCTWSGCVDTGCNMLAAQAASGGAYSFRCDTVLFGSGTKAESSGDAALELPWAMTPLALTTSDATVDATLRLNFSIAPDTYVGQTIREVGIYFTQETGTLPLPTPWLYTRDVIATPYEVVPDMAAGEVTVLTWEAG
jgi:hypothetical protein